MAIVTAALTGCTMVPQPLSDQDISDVAAKLTIELEASPEPIVGLLTVDAAVRRAVLYNQQIKVKELEALLAEAKVRAQSGAMLPELIAQSEYYQRDRPLLTSSGQNRTYNTSTDVRSMARDFTLSWNILDFGLSLLRARQGLDKAQQQHEEANRVRAKLIEETHALFWRAVALNQLNQSLPRLRKQVRAALSLLRLATRDSQIDPTISINFQRDILNSQRELNVLLASLAGAMDQLKQSIAVSFSTSVRLDTIRKHSAVPLSVSTAESDVAIALRLRPEIRQHIYDMRITDEEIHATLLQLLPGVTLSSVVASDSNSHLLHNNWVSWGAKSVTHLIRLVRLPAELDVLEDQQLVHRENALATAATVAMQVYVSRARVSALLSAYRDAENFAQVQRLMLHQVGATVELGKIGLPVLVRERLATLLANVRAILAFSELQAGLASYATAKGENAALVESFVSNRTSEANGH